MIDDKTGDTCKSCRFFWRSEDDPPDEGECRRNAPIEFNRYTLQQTLSLLVWWYIKVHSDRKTANAQTKEFGVEIDNAYEPVARWPTVETGAWCGEYHRRAP